MVRLFVILNCWIAGLYSLRSMLSKVSNLNCYKTEGMHFAPRVAQRLFNLPVLRFTISMEENSTIELLNTLNINDSIIITQRNIDTLEYFCLIP